MVLLKNTDMFLQTDELLSPNRLDGTHIDYQAVNTFIINVLIDFF